MQHFSWASAVVSEHRFYAFSCVSGYATGNGQYITHQRNGFVFGKGCIAFRDQYWNVSTEFEHD